MTLTRNSDTIVIQSFRKNINPNLDTALSG